MQITEFGKTAAGQTVQAVSICAGDVTARFLTLGATLQSLMLAGTDHSLTPGSDTLRDYSESMLYFGAIVGPVANRIARAQTRLNGTTLRFDANENGNLLHGGTTGTHGHLWTIAETTPSSVTFTLTLPDGHGGMPGNRDIRATFAVLPPATLRLTLTATTDAPSLMNLANHSYWNLDGTDHWQGHTLQIAADHILPVDKNLIPTGVIAPVAGTPFDFLKPRTLTPAEPALDTNFCLSPAKTALRDVASLTGASGLCMTLATTEPGLQIYDAERTARPGKPPYGAFAIEAQGWPDAPNHANFPSVQITPDAPYAQTTEWRFKKP